MPDEPTMPGVLLQVLEQHAEDIRAIDVGVVANAWDRANQTAPVQPIIQSRAGETRGIIENVPVIFPGVSWDIQVGEAGLLLFGDLNPRRWWRLGYSARPEGPGLHAAGNAIFLPGLRSQPDARNVPANAAVVDKPAAGGSVRLGDPAATKAALHEDLVTDFNIFAPLFDTWATAVGVASGVPWAGQPVQTAWTTLTNGFSSGKYESPSVRVED
jgi:hypothetical protein